MKKLICILASAALLGACEQETTVTAPPPASPGAEKTVDPNTFSRSTKPRTETKTETSITTAASPTP